MILEAFSRNRIVQGLTEKQVGKLFKAGRVVRIEQGKTIISEGQRPDSLFILLTGEALVFLPASSGRPVQVDLSIKKINDCFGEYSFIDHEPASASIKALRDCAIYMISHDALQSYLDKHRKAGSIVYRNLLTLLVERLRLNNAELDLFNLD